MGNKSAKEPVFKRYQLSTNGKKLSLEDFDTRDKSCFPDRDEAEASAAADITRIDALQDILYAEGKHALLIVLQATDTGGKDSTIRKVFGPVDPLGLRVTSFKAPSSLELSHDYLWRVHKAVPPKGMIGIFNRSHYEDVLIVKVHELVSKKAIDKRYDQINAFERHLVENDVTILKFYLHISKEEQKNGFKRGSTIRPSTGSSIPAISRNARGGMNIEMLTRSRLAVAALEKRPGSSFRPIGSGTETPSSPGSFAARWRISISAIRNRRPASIGSRSIDVRFQDSQKCDQNHRFSSVQLVTLGNVFCFRSRPRLR